MRRAGRRHRIGASLLLAAAVAALAGAAVLVDGAGLAPRSLAPYVEKRTSGHNPAIVGLGRTISTALMTLDRGPQGLPADLVSTLGAQSRAAGEAAPGAIVVADPDAVRAAIARAQPGDVITLLPGTYRFQGQPIDANRPGRDDAPIVVRAVQPGSVHIAFELVEGFRVSAPWWRFENLDIRGVCADDGDCEHAFHVMGAGRHFVARNNTIADFNAHFKINGDGNGAFPDDGTIAANTLYATHGRRTANPVVPVDLVGASNWAVRGNVIKDFVKLDGNGVSYGGFAKGAGRANVFERNLVWCEDKLRNQPGQRIGLSLGGGGTDAPFCRDRKCITEQQDGAIRANLIVSCSDDGIYLNGAAASRVDDNTVLDTGGIEVRFATSSAHLDGNLVDGPIRRRDGGLLHLDDNRTAPLWQSYLGYHPVRNLFRAPLDGDFSWRGEAPRRAGARAGANLCGAGQVTAYGAFDDFAGCRAAR